MDYTKSEQNKQFLATGHKSWFLSAREDAPELLDAGAGTLEDVEANLTEMWRVNRFTGGLRALTHHLYPRLRAHTGTATIADLGTGSAEIPAAITQWAAGNNLSVRIFAIDLAARHLQLARSRIHSTPNIRLLQADAGDLPFAPDSVDYLISSLFLHHLSPEQVTNLLRQTFDHVRCGLILTDITRGVLPLLAFKISQFVFARNYLTRHDGAVSIRRAYTPAELLDLAKSAGLSTAGVYSHPLWRMTLVADK
jgi:hypothetical protein